MTIILISPKIYSTTKTDNRSHTVIHIYTQNNWQPFSYRHRYTQLNKLTIILISPEIYTQQQNNWQSFSYRHRYTQQQNNWQSFSNRHKYTKLEDHWSCIAHLSAEDMLKSAVIEERKSKCSTWVGADNPLGRNFWCQQEDLITMVICCKFKKNFFNLWLYTHLFMIW